MWLQCVWSAAVLWLRCEWSAAVLWLRCVWSAAAVLLGCCRYLLHSHVGRWYSIRLQQIPNRRRQHLSIHQSTPINTLFNTYQYVSQHLLIRQSTPINTLVIHQSTPNSTSVTGRSRRGRKQRQRSQMKGAMVYKLRYKTTMSRQEQGYYERAQISARKLSTAGFVQ